MINQTIDLQDFSRCVDTSVPIAETTTFLVSRQPLSVYMSNLTENNSDRHGEDENRI